MASNVKLYKNPLKCAY